MFSLFIFIHWFFPFALPTYFSALFTSRSAGYRGTLHDSPNRCCVLSFICAVKIAQNRQYLKQTTEMPSRGTNYRFLLLTAAHSLIMAFFVRLLVRGK